MNRVFNILSSFLIIFSCLLMTACGNLLDNIEDDPKFNPIKKQFVKDAKLFGINPNMDNVRISFGDTNKDMKYAGFITISKGDNKSPDGYCQVLKSSNDIAKSIQKVALGNKYNTKVIVVSDKYKNASLDFLETLVYHELGHCVLNYAHRKDSIMEDVYYMGSFRYFWLKEFFTRAPFPIENFKINMVDLVQSSYLPVYNTDHSGFGQRIFQALYIDPQTSKYYLIDNSDEYPKEW